MQAIDFQSEASVIHFYIEECFLFRTAGCPGGDPGPGLKNRSAFLNIGACKLLRDLLLDIAPNCCGMRSVFLKDFDRRDDIFIFGMNASLRSIDACEVFNTGRQGNGNGSRWTSL